jgi:hypothetical protein
MKTLERKIEPVLDRAGIKERTKIERHLAVCDAESGGTHGRLWRRVAAILGELAPLSIQSAGNNTWRFFVADGKYRMQVFALEDPCDGMLRIYLPDVLSQAVKAKILAKTATAETFSVAGTGTRLKIELLGAAEAADAPLHYKHMLGWNRKAMRLSVSTAQTDEKIDGAVQALAALAATLWNAADAAVE